MRIFDELSMKWFNFQLAFFFSPLLAGVLMTSCGNTPKPVQDTQSWKPDLGNMPRPKPFEQDSIILNDDPAAIFFLNPDCPMCQKYQGTFRKMERQNPGVKFYFVLCGQTTLTTIEEFVAYDSMDGSSTILDPTG